MINSSQDVGTFGGKFNLLCPYKALQYIFVHWWLMIEKFKKIFSPTGHN